MSATPSLRSGLRFRVARIGLDLELSPTALFSIAALVSALALVNSEQDLTIRAGPLSMEWRQVKSAEVVAQTATPVVHHATDSEAPPGFTGQGSPLAHVPSHEPP